MRSIINVISWIFLESSSDESCLPVKSRDTTKSFGFIAFEIFSHSTFLIFSASFKEQESGIGSSWNSIISKLAYLEILFLYSFINSLREDSLIFP